MRKTHVNSNTFFLARVCFVESAIGRSVDDQSVRRLYKIRLCYGLNHASSNVGSDPYTVGAEEFLRRKVKGHVPRSSGTPGGYVRNQWRPITDKS